MNKVDMGEGGTSAKYTGTPGHILCALDKRPANQAHPYLWEETPLPSTQDLKSFQEHPKILVGSKKWGEHGCQPSIIFLQTRAFRYFFFLFIDCLYIYSRLSTLI